MFKNPNYMTMKKIWTYAALVFGFIITIIGVIFMAVLAKQDTSPPVATRLQLTFMGMSPRRVSFFVEINGRGTVSRLTAPYGWD